MLKVLFCRGIPASGKSTWAKSFCEKHHNWVRVSRDDLRNMRKPYWLPKQENLITQWERDLIVSALRFQKNVIVDATNLNKDFNESTKFYIEREFGKVIFEYKDFTDVSLEECIKRDLKRPNSVGEKVIRGFYNKYLNPVQPIIQDKSLPKAWIFDIDGTLALFDGRNPFDYDKCDADLPNKPVVDIVNNFYNARYNIIFVSGREDRCKKKTIDWLAKYTFLEKEYIKNHLYMRKTGDRRKDYIVKKEMFDLYFNDKYYIEGIVDDRPQVIRMWKQLGLFVLNVGSGNEF